MKSRVSRRQVLIGAGSAMAIPPVAARELERPRQQTELLAILGPLHVERQVLTPEEIDQIRESTAESLAKGVSTYQGMTLERRTSGFSYHPKLIEHLATGFGIDTSLSPRKQIRMIMEKMKARSGIRGVDPAQAKLELKEAEKPFRLFANSLRRGEVGLFAYIPKDRKEQHMYLVEKGHEEEMILKEVYPISTSRREPTYDTTRKTTPLGQHTVPSSGVSINLPGQVISVEKPDQVKRLFAAVKIDNRILPFVNDLDAVRDGEIPPVATDSLMLWSRNAQARGIKIHDTTVLDELGTAASSGCIRTPAVRRIVLATSRNKFPTQVYVFWEGARTLEDMEAHGGYGGIFGGENERK